VQARGGAGAGVDAARQVDGDDERSAGRPRGRQHRDQARSGFPQPGGSAEADDAVDDEVGLAEQVLGARRPDEPAARGAQRGEPGRVDLGREADRGDPDAAPGEPGTGPQGVATVVAGADQEDGVGARQPAAAPAELPGADGGEAGSGTLHEGTVGGAGEQVVLGGADGVHAPRPLPQGGPVGAHGSSLCMQIDVSLST
jgi:hypothetical protein